MAERRPSLMQPKLESLLERVEHSKFTLVTLASKRAREINDYYNQLSEGLGRIVPPQVTSVSRKPLSIALEEVDVGKITFERIDPDATDDATGDESESEGLAELSADDALALLSAATDGADPGPASA